ncbi:MAG TPA: hypothetical protein VGH19_00095 [Verrucomicrobiae bacterium]
MMFRLLFSLLVVGLLSGCASRQPVVLNGRKFDFARDTFSYPNELVWVYYRDKDSGEFLHSKQDPVPEYTHHCFVVARAAKQFFVHAEFKPQYLKVSDEEYRTLVQRIRNSDPRKGPGLERVLIPGYADLKSFSRDHEAMLKAECGPAWLSYTQRGHWRMIMPLNGSQREKNAQKLTESVRMNGIAVAHVVTFPKLKINHAVVIYDYVKTAEGMDFTAYDSNNPKAPVVIRYNSTTKQFNFPETNYYEGGELDVYEVFHRWNY